MIRVFNMLIILSLIMSSTICLGYGNITQVETSGASSKTARQDRLDYDGRVLLVVNVVLPI